MPSKLSYGAAMLLASSNATQVEGVQNGTYRLKFKGESSKYSYISALNCAARAYTRPDETLNFQNQVHISGSEAEGRQIRFSVDRDTCPNQLLGSHTNCGVIYPAFTDVDNAYSRWNIKSNDDGSFKISSVGRDACPHKHFAHTNGAGTFEMNTAGLSYKNYDILLEPWTPAKPLEFPEHIQITSSAKTDGKTELAASAVCTNNFAFMERHLNTERLSGWKLIKAGDSPNTFNIQSFGRNCQKKLLSSGAGCSAVVSTWQRDDGLGGQRWTIERVEGQQDKFYIKADKPKCPSRYLSTRPVWDRLELKNTQNLNSQFSIEEHAPWQPKPISLPDKVWISFDVKGKKEYLTIVNRCNTVTRTDPQREGVLYFSPEPVEGKVATYKLRHSQQCDNKINYLSSTIGCASNIVYYFKEDYSPSYPQEFLIQEVEGQSGKYTIQARGQDGCENVYLRASTTLPTTANVASEDHAGIIVGIEPFVQEPQIDISECATITSFDKTDEKTRVSHPHYRCAGIVDLTEPGTDGDENIHNWMFVPVKSEYSNTFNIISTSDCDKKYLSASPHCGAATLLATQDTGTGLEQWIVEVDYTNPKAYALRNIAKRGCTYTHVVYRDKLPYLSLYGNEIANYSPRFQIDTCKPEDKTVYDIPKCARVKSVVKTNGLDWLSTHQLCAYNNNYLSKQSEIDVTKFADWEMKPVEGKLNTFNLLITEKRDGDQTNCNKRYLSSTAGCGNVVTMWDRDDNSGLQQWTLRKVQGTKDKYTFHNQGKGNCPPQYLSTASVASASVVLWKSRYAENQYYEISAGQCSFPEPEPIDISEGCNFMSALAKVDGAHTLVSNVPACQTYVWMKKQEEIDTNDVFSNKWDFQPVEGKANTFTITAENGNCDRKFLSSTAGCTVNTNLWYRDENNGLQHWTISKNEAKEGVYYITNRGKEACKATSLAYTPRAAYNTLQAITDVNDYQEFSIKSCAVKEEKKADVPSCGRIHNVGKTDQRELLSVFDNSCYRFSQIAANDRINMEQRFNFIPVDGKDNTYNIVSMRKGCDRIYLSVGAGCGQAYIDLVQRDDGSGRQQWKIVKTDNGFQMTVLGREKCERVILSTRNYWTIPHLWKAQTGSGFQDWTIAECPANEPAPVDHSSEWFWKQPSNNEWNWGPNWNQPQWNWKPNQGNTWREIWNNRPDLKKDFKDLDWNTNTKFRFWLEFVRDREYIKPETKAQNSKLQLKSKPGSPQIFLGGEGVAWDWVQVEGLRGWGAIKLAESDLYLRPRKIDGRIKNGSPVVLGETLTPACLWFWNGKRLRHQTGRWYKISDDGTPIVDRDAEGPKSILRMIGPDQSPLTNFPGIKYVSDDLLWDTTDDKEEDDKLPKETTDNDNEFDREASDEDKKTTEPNDKEVEDEGKGKDDEDDKELEKIDIGSLDFNFDEDEDLEGEDNLDEDDGEDLDKADLPLEKGKRHPPVQPDVDGKVPDSNCCTSVSRKSEAVPFNAASAASFITAYQRIISTGNQYIYQYASEAASELPDSMKPAAVFRLGDTAPADNVVDPLARHFAANPDKQPSTGVVRRVFKKCVNNLEDQLEIIDFAVEMLRIANHPQLANFEKNQAIVHENVKNFYSDVLKPHRFAYNIFSKVPISQGTVSTLQVNMVDKLRDFSNQMREMNKLGLEFRANEYIQYLTRNVRRLDEEGAHERLRNILLLSRRAMVKINQEVIEKELNKNANFLTFYENAANALFRANDSKSVRCLAIWALKRRQIEPRNFETAIMNEEEFNNKWMKFNDAKNVKNLLIELVEGQEGDATEHLDEQRRQVNSYIDAVFETTRQAAKAAFTNEGKGPNAGAFFKRYYTRMGPWRYSLKNIAL